MKNKPKHFRTLEEIDGAADMPWKEGLVAAPVLFLPKSKVQCTLDTETFDK